MKSFNKFLLAGFMTMGLFACSDSNDAPDATNNENASKQSVYMQFKMELPTTGRSATDESGNTNSNANPDYEVGNNAENTVKSIYVVLVKAENGDYVTSSYVTENYFDQVAGDDMTTNNIYTVPFDADKLTESLESQNVKIFVFCNPITALKNELDKKGNLSSFQDLAYTLTSETDATAWTANGFPMSNAEIATKNLPSDFNNHRTPETAYFLGTVRVERSVARFDYAAKNEGNTYNLQTVSATDNTTVVDIKLTNVALLNLSKSFYYLRRVAASSDDTKTQYNANQIVLCGTENMSNWVVDTDHAAKMNWTENSTWENNFYYSMTSATEGYNHVEGLAWTNLTDIANNTADQWNSTDNTNDYHIWRYATENTIPAINKQVQAITTHVVFKGELVAGTAETTDATALAARAAINAGTEQIIIYKDVVYGTWTDVVAKVTKDNTIDLSTDLGQAVSLVQRTAGENDITSDNLAAAGFKGITPINGKYEVLYYYKNRHNDNNDPNNMGIMEFNVVRNNVYKLMVDKINKFGHPTNPNDPDPDPEDPNDPDEEDIVYFNVSVEVLPWVVRVNNIEF